MPQNGPAEGGEAFNGHMGERASDAVPFVVSHLLGRTYTRAWCSARDGEVMSLLRALRIRPSDVKTWEPNGDGGHAAWDTVMDIGLPGLARGGGRSGPKAGS